MIRLLFNISILTMIVSSVLNSCSTAGHDAGTADSRNRFAYDMNSPDNGYELEPILREISGISWYGHNKIACIQDELGIIYLFDEGSGEISDSYTFGKHGDYEGIAVYQDTAWVLESNGTIYKVTNFTDDNRKTFIFKTPLSARNDAEGLVYDVSKNNLLIACKNHPSIDEGKKLSGFKAIYRFETHGNKLKEKPEYLIDHKWFNDFEETKYFKKVSLDLAKKLQLAENTVFNPSGLAIHPFDDDIYIISATPGRLIVMSRDGKIRYIQTLDKRIFRQPEGICFSPDGDLYISNEGNNGRGNILKFKYRPK